MSPPSPPLPQFKTHQELSEDIQALSELQRKPTVTEVGAPFVAPEQAKNEETFGQVVHGDANAEILQKVESDAT